MIEPTNLEKGMIEPTNLESDQGFKNRLKGIDFGYGIIHESGYIWVCVFCIMYVDATWNFKVDVAIGFNFKRKTVLTKQITNKGA